MLKVNTNKYLKTELFRYPNQWILPTKLSVELASKNPVYIFFSSSSCKNRYINTSVLLLNGVTGIFLIIDHYNNNLRLTQLDIT